MVKWRSDRCQRERRGPLGVARRELGALGTGNGRNMRTTILDIHMGGVVVSCGQS